MITGEMKNKVDSIWDTIWTGGITSPITVLEQITYLMFMKLLDDNQLKAEANANVLGVPLKNKVFQEGICTISENPKLETDYKNLRWSIFHNFEPGEMLTNIQLYVFPFIKTIGEGKDTAFSRYMPNRMSVDRDEHGQLYYKYQRGSDEPGGRSEVVILRHPDVLHIPGLGFDGLVGYSPIAMAKNAIGLAIAAEEFGAKFYANGAAPGGILEHPGTIKDPNRVRESWQSTFGGSGNSNKIAVLEEGMKFTPISIAPDQAQFLETRKFQINEIARIFRVPPHMVGDLEKSSFSNIEQQSLEFVKYTLDPWVTRWEQSLMRTLFTEEEKKAYFIKFNLEGLLRGDYASRMSGYATARQNGWMSANDIRELENMDRIPAEDGGDLYLIKSRTLAEIQASAKGRLQRDIQSLLEMEPRPSPENIFYAVYCYEEERFPKICANLSYRSEILTQDLPEHYAWELTDWAEILGSSVAETKLTVDYMKKILADIIEEMTFFGSEQSACEKRIAVVKQSLLKAEESIRRGETVPEEEVFARFGLPRDEHDEAAAELSRKVTHVPHRSQGAAGRGGIPPRDGGCLLNLRQ